MWSISSKADYALSFVSSLVGNYGRGPISLRSISQQKQLPYKYLEQIVRQLKADGVVKSVEGRRGGYELAQDPKKVSMHRVLAAVEDLKVIKCGQGRKKCRREKNCGQKPALTMIQKRLVAELDKISLAEMVAMKED